MQIPTLCLSGIHLIAQLPTGVYSCSHCHQLFHEHHEIAIRVGAGATSQTPVLPREKEPLHGRPD